LDSGGLSLTSKTEGGSSEGAEIDFSALFLFVYAIFPAVDFVATIRLDFLRVDFATPPNYSDE
jgi:hypothetical protein